jgi:hypothetical protein
MAGGESPFRGPAPAPEGSPAIVLALSDALRRRNAARLQRRAVAGGLLGGDSAFREARSLVHQAYWSDDEQEIIAVSSWVSRDACDAWRASWEETRRRAAMAPYVLTEQEGFYRGRELIVPEQP